MEKWLCEPDSADDENRRINPRINRHGGGRSFPERLISDFAHPSGDLHRGEANGVAWSLAEAMALPLPSEFCIDEIAFAQAWMLG